MKIFTYIIFALALVFIGVNISMINFKNPFEGNSLIAIIGILAILCAVVILLIFNISKSIDKKIKNQS
jgi:cell division protein FtsX